MIRALNYAIGSEFRWRQWPL